MEMEVHERPSREEAKCKAANTERSRVAHPQRTSFIYHVDNFVLLLNKKRCHIWSWEPRVLPFAGDVHLRRAVCSCAHFRISLSAETSPSFRTGVAFISPVLTLACLPAICPRLHRHCLDPELRILQYPPPPRQLMQLIKIWMLGSQTQSKGIPANQSSCCFFVV